MPKIIAMIPARYASSRLPGKLMLVLGGRSVILRTYQTVLNTNLFDEVIVVCDDERILLEIQSHGGQAMMSEKSHESGTDRIAEVATRLDADIFVNIQGDEPFISKEALVKVIELFERNEVQVASLMMPITDIEKINNPNCVKVVVDKYQKALYFSRAAIPFYRDKGYTPSAFQHVGVYAFRKEALLEMTSLPVSSLEEIEKLENLRLLENGIPIHLAIIEHVGISIDTAEDYKAAIKYLESISDSH